MVNLYFIGLPVVSSALFSIGLILFSVVTFHYLFHVISLRPYSALDGTSVLAGITSAWIYLTLGVWGMSRSPRAFFIRSFSKERRKLPLDAFDMIAGHTLEKSSFAFNRTVPALLASKFRVVRLLNVDSAEQIPRLDPGYLAGVVLASITGLIYLTRLQEQSLDEALVTLLASIASVGTFLVWRARPRTSRKGVIGVTRHHIFMSGKLESSQLFHQKLRALPNELSRFRKEMAAPAPMLCAHYIRNLPTTFSDVYCSEAHWPLVVEEGFLTAALCVVDVTEVFHGSATHQELVMLRKFEDEKRRSRLQTIFVCSLYDYNRAAQYCADNFDIERSEIISLNLAGHSGREDLENRMNLALKIFLKRSA